MMMPPKGIKFRDHLPQGKHHRQELCVLGHPFTNNEHNEMTPLEQNSGTSPFISHLSGPEQPEGGIEEEFRFVLIESNIIGSYNLSALTPSYGDDNYSLRDAYVTLHTISTRRLIFSSLGL